MNEKAMVKVERYETIEGRRMAFIEGDPEPYISDEELGRLMGATTDSVRKAKRRLVNRKFLNENEVLESLSETSPSGGRPGRAYYFTEEQAYTLISQSNSALAPKLTREMARVYRAWRKGQIAPRTPAPAGLLEQTIEPLRRVQAELLDRVRVLEARKMTQLRFGAVGGENVETELRRKALKLIDNPANTWTSREQIARRLGCSFATGRFIVAELFSGGEVTKINGRIVRAGLKVIEGGKEP